MNTFLKLVSDYWGLIIVATAMMGYLVYDYEATKKKIASLIFIAEERSRELALHTGQQKFNWVVQNGYKFLPAWLKFFITEEAFKILVQNIFDSIVKWAEAQKLREND